MPFFWSMHYDVAIRYVGHAKEWDRVTVDGNVKVRDATVRYYKRDVLHAVASVGRDQDALLAARDLRA